MKKTGFWLAISAVLFVVVPLIIRFGIRDSYTAQNIIENWIIPLYFVILGISVGKSIKRHWFLPAVSLVLSFISYAFISTTGKSWGYGAITVLTIIYMVLFATSMLLTVAFSKVIN